MTMSSEDLRMKATMRYNTTQIGTAFKKSSELCCFPGFQPGPTQIGLYNHFLWLEACNFGFRKYRDCTIYVAKAKVLISCTVIVQLICVFVFAYAKNRFFYGAAHFERLNLNFPYGKLLTFRTQEHFAVIHLKFK